MFLWRNKKIFILLPVYIISYLFFRILQFVNLGPIVQNLMKLSANVMLKFLSWNMANTFFWYSLLKKKKNVSSFCKSYLHFCSKHIHVFEPASVAQLDAPSDWRPGGRGFNPRRGRQHSFVEIDHEIFSTVILSLPLIQEGQLSVSGERMCTVLVNRLED